ncbi:hypothetical protein CJ030_MR2G028955 [Morella rubra]|uniref:Uncharacterized protein n=1 Tax=Morella rubra TaxID=262757 RepID=A0A6A1WKH2_9ROSI|nr:hypothetical protein CJ030_MR2G028955 [Morella rubra]
MKDLVVAWGITPRQDTINSLSSSTVDPVPPTFPQIVREVEDDRLFSRGCKTAAEKLTGEGSLIIGALPNSVPQRLAVTPSRNSLLPHSQRLLPQSQRQDPAQILAELQKQPFLLDNDVTSDPVEVGDSLLDMCCF